MGRDRKPPTIYQEEPLCHRQSAFRPKGWTETEAGYLYEADKLARCSLLNGKYTWAVAINVEAELWPEEIKNLWTKACRVLRDRGVVALWVREPSTQNHCNYHMIVKNEMTREALEDAIEKAMPHRTAIPWHKHVRPVRSQYHYCRYITKAKTGDCINGKEIKDKYGARRLLFQAKLKLRKVGTIGKFWERSKKELWQGVRDYALRIAEGLEQPKIRLLAQHLHKILGDDVPLWRIERSFGFFAKEPHVQAWADQVVSEAGESVT
jgi:hypothetical protein